jgi:hypothetical protein
MIDLNEQERKTVVGADKEFYRLMKIVMTADCYSYRFVIDPDGRWPIMKKQIEKNFDAYISSAL